MAWQFPTSLSKIDGSLAVNLGTTDNMIVANGILVASNATAVQGTGSGHQVRVAGSVFGSVFGIKLIGPASAANDYLVKVDTSGLLFANSGSAIALYGTGNTVSNAGEVNSNYYGIYFNATADGTVKVTNSGTIYGEDIAIARHSSDKFGVTLVNSGLIEGEYAFGVEGGVNPTGVDAITNTGRMIGDILLRGGNDLYNGTNGRLKGTIYGEDGNDRIYGGADSDLFHGGTGDDILKGNAGNDKLWGEVGNDDLQGGAGNDALSGGGNNDKLYGGAGADKLYGGSGADTFIFKATSDSTVSASGRDTIYDFSRSQHDRIDLGAIDANTKASGNQAFSFIGKNAFHKVAGELKYEQKNGDTFISGDVNGDGKADFMIVLDTLVALKAGDFIL